MGLLKIIFTDFKSPPDLYNLVPIHFEVKSEIPNREQIPTLYSNYRTVRLKKNIFSVITNLESLINSFFNTIFEWFSQFLRQADLYCVGKMGWAESMFGWTQNSDIRMAHLSHSRDVTLVPNWIKMARMRQIWRFLRSVSVNFGSASQNVLKLILKTPRFVPFLANLTKYGCQIWDPCWKITGFCFQTSSFSLRCPLKYPSRYEWEIMSFNGVFHQVQGRL